MQKSNSYLARVNISVVPLSIDGAQGDGPQVWAEASQLGNVVGHLKHNKTHSKGKTQCFYGKRTPELEELFSVLLL